VSIIHTNLPPNGFLLTWFAPSNDLFEVQWSSNLPPTWNTFASPNPVTYDVAKYSGNQTNTQFDFFDDGTQTGGFSPTRFYQILLLNGTNASPSVVALVNGVPLPFTTAAGKTNFFSFDVTRTNGAVLFELYNLSGSSLLTLQRSNLPLSSPYFATSGVAASANYQQIVLRTNGTVSNLNAVSWFLGVTNQGASPLNYTVRAVVQTNGILVSGLPIGTKVSQSGSTNIQLAWNPTVSGEIYEVRTNGNLATTNWGALTDITALGTSLAFTNSMPTAGLPALFYWVVQVP
jgi:hypothetical protein